MDLLIVILFFSLGLNIFFFGFLLSKKNPITFEEAFYVLNSVIESQKVKLVLGLRSLSKKYMILNHAGDMEPPNDSIKEYAEKKQELKTAITKKIVHNLSKDVRKKILEYYTDRGMVNYIIFELDKDGGIE